MNRVLATGAAIVALAGTAVAAQAQPSTAKVTLATFAGHWTGHTRGMSISRRGIVKERVDDGCCTHLFSARYKLSDPRGSAAHPVVTATVTRAEVPDPSLFSKAFPAPRVGQKTTFRIRHTEQAEILTVTKRGVTYCRHVVGEASPCGA